MKSKVEYWPWLITIILVGFIGLMLTLVFIASKQPLNLVDENYYDKAVIFQSDMDKISNATALAEKPQINIENGQFSLTFPESLDKELKGQISFYSPISKKEDKDFEIKLIDQNQVIDLSAFRKGRWVVNLSWQSAGEDYIIKQNIVLE